MVEKKLREIRFGVYHQGCFGSDFMEKFPEVEMKEYTHPQIVKKNKTTTWVKCAWKVKAPTPKDLDEFLDALDKEPRIVELTVFKKIGSNALALVIFKGPGSSYEHAAKEESVFISPVTQKAGFEIYDILSTDPKALARVVDDVESVGEVKLFSLGKFTPEKKPYNLTEKQWDALKTALENGYYSWPRKITLEQLALKCGMNRRAYQELLRKAEAKALPELIKSIAR